MISLLDPTGLLGREVATALAESCPELRQRYFHTSRRDEHLIAEVAGEASIVARLDALDELSGSAVVVVTEPPDQEAALELLSWLRESTDVALVDLSQPGVAGELAVTVLDSPPAVLPSPSWYHVVDPALIGPTRVVGALAQLQPQAVSVVATQPASAFGEEAMHELAAQAAARLSGSSPPAPERLPGVLAFDIAPAPAERSYALQHQLESLLPGVGVTVELLDAGVFHGNTATVAVTCAVHPTAATARSLLRDVPGLSVARPSARVEIGDLSRLDGALCSPPRISGNTVTVFTVADGLHLTGSQLAPTLIAEVSARVS